MGVLVDRYDALLFDLDGTLFRGATALPGAAEAVTQAQQQGLYIGYLTNNASRSGAEVVEHLRSFGFPVEVQHVVTSAQAAVRILADRLAQGTEVLVVGTDALAAEVRSAGLTVVTEAESAHAVVQGHSPDTDWAKLAEACLAIRAGALWVACNIDVTLPDERGLLPGNGAMVAALEKATGCTPVVAGKPEAGLFDEAVRRSGASRPLVVGDRLDTDIAGANAVGLPSLHVLTGVSGPSDVLTAAEQDRPTYLGADLAALHLELAQVSPVAGPPWQVQAGDGELRLAAGSPQVGSQQVGDPDPVGALRALCDVHWTRGGGPVRVRAMDPTAARALVALRMQDVGLQEAAAPVASAVD